MLGRDDLIGLRLLDIGCGSGLHTLAALRLGAAFVQAVDIDPECVSTTRALLERHYDGANYRAAVGNIFLLKQQVQEQFDVVYSWGVLHHTGDMWEAISKAAEFVNSEGLFVLAIYQKTPRCEDWKKVKKRYNDGSRLVRARILAGFVAHFFYRQIRKGRNPLSIIRLYNANRGMNWTHDVLDWLGGYPYESASADKIERFVCPLGFRLEQTFGTDSPSGGRFGSQNAEYRFRRLDPGGS